MSLLTDAGMTFGRIALGASPTWRWDRAGHMFGSPGASGLTYDDDTWRAVRYLSGPFHK